MSLLDRIRNWRLRRGIPENQHNEKRWRYAGDGMTKIYLDDNDEIKKYRHARKRQKEKEDLEL